MENGRGCWEISHGAWAQRAAKRRGHLGQTFSFFLFLSLGGFEGRGMIRNTWLLIAEKKEESPPGGSAVYAIRDPALLSPSSAWWMLHSAERIPRDVTNRLDQALNWKLFKNVRNCAAPRLNDSGERKYLIYSWIEEPDQDALIGRYWALPCTRVP